MILPIPNVVQLIKEGEVYLVGKGVPNARRNAEWLLAHALRSRNTELYMDAARIPSAAETQDYNRLLGRRGAREPLQYVLGSTEFMSLPFYASAGVFIPRPETEVLVETAEAQLTVSAGLAVLDLCCGSGVIAVSLVKRIANTTAIAIDIDENATTLTRRNAVLNGVRDRVDCIRADAATFLRDTSCRFDVIVCNPPYVRSDEIELLSPEIKLHESLISLDGGPDGLGLYRRVAPLLARCLRPKGAVAFEIAPSQSGVVHDVLRTSGFADITVRPDYTGLDRVITGRSA